MESYYQEFITNLSSNSLETVTLEDQDHWVIPTVAITEGVHEGNKGKILYLSEDGKKDPTAWDHKPAVINHPTLNEQPASASTPEVINNQKVGYPLNTVWEDAMSEDSVGRLKMKVYVNKDRLKDRSEKVYNALSKGEKVEVSTGLFVDIERKKGVWNGQEYDGIARNWRPDHLAILPDDKGACSIDKGAGLLVNSLVTNDLSLGDIESKVGCAIRDKFESPGFMWMGWVSDVFNGYAIYYQEGSYYQQNYTMKDGVVTLTGDPVKVVRETVYRSVTNKQWVGNASGQLFTKEEFVKMGKKELIDAILLANKDSMDENDRPFLDKKDEKALKAMHEKFVTKKNEPEPEPTPEPTVNKKLVTNSTDTKATAKDIKEALDAVDPRYRPILNKLAEERADKEESLRKVILANKNNRFSEDYLKEKDEEELQAMVDLMGGVPDDAAVENATPRKGRFIANAGGPARSNAVPTEVLDYEDADFGD